MEELALHLELGLLVHVLQVLLAQPAIFRLAHHNPFYLTLQLRLELLEVKENLLVRPYVAGTTIHIQLVFGFRLQLTCSNFQIFLK